MENSLSLISRPSLIVKQAFELGEWIGFETRNKYSIHDERGVQIAFAAEQQKGIFGFLIRQYLGHWRTFDVHFFTPDRKCFLIGHHPFRWFFQRIEVKTATGEKIGAIQKRFAVFSKRFDIENEFGAVVMQVNSPIWRIWTFPFMVQGRKVAEVQKKWSGAISEVLTDRDNFRVEFVEPGLGEHERLIVMASAIFIDLLYFERKN